MIKKKKVLMVSEYHKLASGFGTYAKNILDRLYKTGKYELAEFSCYARPSDGKDVPWKFYGNAPEDNEPQDQKDQYNNNANSQFGAWRFDKVCLDFKPDIVLSYRDPWMDMFISKSALRPYFHWVWMPTVDSDPQKQSWIEGFANTDAILCYSEFGVKTLQKDAGHLCNIVGCASPGIDPEIYKIYNKQEIRNQLGINADINIIGTVMRNQKRKLFPELIKSFEKFLKTAPPEISRNTFLYLHTSYPEKMGWNLGYLISEYEVGGRILTTYVCRECKNFYADFFKDAINFCPKCQKVSAVMPSVAMGLEVPDLVKVYNAFDLYIQYAICEGFGMPQVEAAACGVPVVATDYSAMEDVLDYTQGYAIPVQKMYRELETNAERAYPDNDKLTDIMIEYLMMPKEDRLKKGLEVREATIKRYHWDDTARVWENYIDTYRPKNLQSQWASPPKLFQIPESIPQQIITNDQYVEWLYGAVLNEPKGAFTYDGVKLVRDLNFGAFIEQGIIESINRESVFNSFKQRAQNKIILEQIRSGMAIMTPDPFIVEANK